jgi:hypothetical protein
MLATDPDSGFMGHPPESEIHTRMTAVRFCQAPPRAEELGATRSTWNFVSARGILKQKQPPGWAERQMKQKWQADVRRA